MKPTPLFESDRRFSIFSYEMSHGLLLLRSKKEPPRIPTRLDIEDVRAMEIRAWFNGIRIEEIETQRLEKQNSRPGDLLAETGNKAYRLVRPGWEGFILCGTMSSHEDHEEFFAPSKLLAIEAKGK